MATCSGLRPARRFGRKFSGRNISRIWRQAYSPLCELELCRRAQLPRDDNRRPRRFVGALGDRQRMSAPWISAPAEIPSPAAIEFCKSLKSYLRQGGRHHTEPRVFWVCGLSGLTADIRKVSDGWISALRGAPNRGTSTSDPLRFNHGWQGPISETHLLVPARPL